MRTYSYFELKRGKTYTCSLDDPEFKGRFEYRLFKHYLAYRKIGYDHNCPAEGKQKNNGWRGVWVNKWYDEQLASYQEVGVWVKPGTEKKTSSKPKNEYHQRLIDAARVVNPTWKFIDGCEAFLNKAGFLTAKQIDSLGKVKPRKGGGRPRDFEREDKESERTEGRSRFHTGGDDCEEDYPSSRGFHTGHYDD